MTQAVGIVGLGLLGSALAERLLNAGFDVIAYDVDADCRDRCRILGAIPVADLAIVGRRCRRILLSLPDAIVSGDVARQLAGHVPANSFIIDTTTGDPNRMAAIGDELAEAGIGYLDATIAGSSALAREGRVLTLIGGDDSDVAACRDIIEAISSQSLHVGPRGSGARMKLVVNLVLGLNRAVFAEGLAFAKSLGLEPGLALDVLARSPASSKVMETKGEKMITGDFTPQARLRQHLKDVQLILDAATAAGAKTPLSQRHAELLQSLVDRGFGEEDNSAIVRAFE